MLNKQEQLERIKLQLEPIEADEALVEDLFDGWYDAALQYSNRKYGDDAPALLRLVRGNVLASYHKRGNEGTTSAAEGAQSASYEDLEAALRESIVSGGLRLPNF